MLLNQINHKMPIYKDCTLGEMMTVGTAVFITNSLLLSLITKLLFGFAWIGFAFTILSLVAITKLLLGRLQKIKYGKPYGFYQQLFFKKIQQIHFMQRLFKLPFVERQGKWSVRRTS